MSTEKMNGKLMASVTFGGGLGDPEFTQNVERDFQFDVDAAAAELQQAGYEVHRFPDKYAGLLAHPLDDFIEAVIDGPNDDKVIDAIFAEVNSIVGKYGGDCDVCGPVKSDYVPFVDLIKEATQGVTALWERREEASNE